MHDVYEWWNKAENPNRKKQSKQVVDSYIKYVEENVKHDKTILDFGAGIGRMLEAYNKEHIITAIDISKLYQERITNKAQQMELNFKWQHIQKDNQLSFNDNEFDVVVCSQVIMHQLPYDVIPIMTELKRVGRKVLIISKQANKSSNNIKPIEKIKEYNKMNFNYDFNYICKKCSFKMINRQMITKNHIGFCY